jgi:hypothetical protein
MTATPRTGSLRNRLRSGCRRRSRTIYAAIATIDGVYLAARYARASATAGRLLPGIRHIDHAAEIVARFVFIAGRRRRAGGAVEAAKRLWIVDQRSFVGGECFVEGAANRRPAMPASDGIAAVCSYGAAAYQTAQALKPTCQSVRAASTMFSILARSTGMLRDGWRPKPQDGETQRRSSPTTRAQSAIRSRSFLTDSTQ